MGKQPVVLNGVTLYPVDLLILQATPFCNIDCTYCYLPGRTRKGRMPLEVVDMAARRVVEADLVGERLAVVWHAGEPLAVGAGYMAALMDACGPLSASGACRSRPCRATSRAGYTIASGHGPSQFTRACGKM